MDDTRLNHVLAGLDDARGSLRFAVNEARPLVDELPSTSPYTLALKRIERYSDIVDQINEDIRLLNRLAEGGEGA